MIEEINAITLTVSNMDRSVDFYTSLGLSVEYGGQGSAFTTFRIGRQALNLMEGDPDDVAGWGRVILWVDDVDAMHERVLGLGLSPEAAPRDASWGERYFHLDDPDGHQLSLARPIGRQ